MMSKMREPIYLIPDTLHIDKLKKIYYNIFIKNIKKGLAKNEKINRLSNCNIIFVNRHPAINNFFNFSIYVWNRSKLVRGQQTTARKKRKFYETKRMFRTW